MNDVLDHKARRENQKFGLLKGSAVLLDDPAMLLGRCAMLLSRCAMLLNHFAMLLSRVALLLGHFVMLPSHSARVKNDSETNPLRLLRVQAASDHALFEGTVR
jgi:hypothetical protein